MAIGNPEDWAENMVNWKTGEPLIKVNGKPIAEIKYIEPKDDPDSMSYWVEKDCPSILPKEYKNYDQYFMPPLKSYGKMKLDEVDKHVKELEEVIKVWVENGINPLTYTEDNFEFLEI